MITKKMLLAAAAIAPAALAFAAPAQAQVAGIATANPTAVVAKAKAFAAANQQISTTYKQAFDQMIARRQAMQKEVEPLLTQLDTNKDKQISEVELQTAQRANNPVLTTIKTAQDKAEAELARLGNPAARAELFAIEMILMQYQAAQQKVIAAKKINVVLMPDVVMYAPDAIDISDQIVAEIDRASPSVSITPPATWNPARETVAIQQQIAQLRSAALQQQRQQAAAQPPAGQPATAAARPATSTPQQQPPSR